MIAVLVNLLSIITIFASLYYCFYTFASLPQNIPVHFNLKGEPDKWNSKKFIFTFPFMETLIYGLFKLLPSYDKYKFNYIKFKIEMNIFILTFMCFLGYVNILVIVFAKNQYDITLYFIPSLGVLFIICGFTCYRSYMTEFFGFKHKLAFMSNEKWKKCNRAGGLIMAFSGFLMVISFIVKLKIIALISFILFICIIIILNFLWSSEFKKEIEINKNKHTNEHDIKKVQ